MASGRFNVSYVEEDGFEITRGEVVLTVYGTCEGEYSWYYSSGRMTLANGDPGYPEEGELEQESFDCWVDTIEIDGEEQEDGLEPAGGQHEEDDHGQDHYCRHNFHISPGHTGEACQ